MKKLSYFFFYTYIGLVALAGFWGAFIYPAFDFRFLFEMDVQQLPDFQRINLLSQYRFLRALELGFGIFSLVFVRQIFSENLLNRLFLFIMLSGILARVFSLLFDGYPGKLTWFFLIYETVGWITIFSYTKNRINYGNAR